MTDSRTKNVRQSSDNEHSSRLQLRKLIRVPFSSLVQKIGHANFLSSDKARYLGCQYTFIIGSCHDPFILSADGETVTHLEFHWCFKEEDHSTSTFMHLRQFSSCDTITPQKKSSFFPTSIIISSKRWQILNLYLQKLIVLLNGS